MRERQPFHMGLRRTPDKLEFTQAFEEGPKEWVRYSLIRICVYSTTVKAHINHNQILYKFSSPDFSGLL